MTETKQNREPRRVLVVGLGVSGRAVCEMLLKQGVAVVATDLSPREKFGGALESLEAGGCVLRLGEHRTDDFQEADQIVVSPGIPLDIAPLREAAARSVEIVGELEWAWRQVSLPTIAVTGTNGKTTTTSLLGEIFRAWGEEAFVGGNIGTPLSRRLLDGMPEGRLILEVSSFQLDTASRFNPDVAVLLNVTEDHLDRYEDFASYADSKFSIFSRQRSDQTAVLNLDDEVCRGRLGEIEGKILLFSRKIRSAHARVEGRTAVVGVPGAEPFEIELDRAGLKGIHNEENIMAAALAATAAGAPAQAVLRAVYGYAGLPHRVEWVCTRRGVDFYDDSKGTNVGAVVKALQNFDRPVQLLMGGRDKLGSYEPIVSALAEKGRGAYVFGEAAPRMREAMAGRVPVRAFAGLAEALDAATAAAEPGDVVLLSPACSSYDQYKSYAERGDHFKRLVAELPE